MKKYLLILLVIVATSCEKEEIPAGLETRVYGRFADYFDSPNPNVKIKIGEYRFVPNTVNGGWDVLQRWVDSTTTNQNGEYDLTFESTGRGTSYKLVVPGSPTQQYSSLQDAVEIENIGGEFNLNSNQILNLYPCDVTINPNNLIYFPIGIWHQFTLNTNTMEINSNSTFIKRIFIPKYNNQTINFYRVKPDGINQSASFTFPESNVETLTIQNIVLSESDFVDI